jgi:hypothetical protein
MLFDDYELIPVPDSEVYAIKLTVEPYNGITYCYGKCSVSDEEDHAELTFEYDIIEDIDTGYDVKLFEKFIGDKLVEILEEQLMKNSVVYSGGSDDGVDNED